LSGDVGPSRWGSAKAHALACDWEIVVYRHHQLVGKALIEHEPLVDDCGWASFIRSCWRRPSASFGERADKKPLRSLVRPGPIG